MSNDYDYMMESQMVDVGTRGIDRGEDDYVPTDEYTPGVDDDIPTREHLFTFLVEIPEDGDWDADEVRRQIGEGIADMYNDEAIDTDEDEGPIVWGSYPQ